MDTLFHPDSVAVIGASSDPDKTAGKPVRYLQRHGYGGDIYPVNPGHDRIAGLDCYPDIGAVPGTPDLVVVMLPTALVLDVVSDCLEAGVRNVLIVSTGFAETRTEEGIEDQRQLVEWAREYDATILGPMCQGVVNFHTGLAASHTPALESEELLAGPIGFVTQSGAFGGALSTYFHEKEIGLSKLVATGNEAVVGALDFLEYLDDDDRTDIVAGYIEGFDDGRKLVELKRTESGIDLPIVFLKVGESERARTAAASHTGTIAGEFDIYRGVFSEMGVMMVDDVDLFFAVNDTLTKLDSLPGERLGVPTTSGGAGVHIVDTAHREGLTIPDPASETRERIEEYIPSAGSTLNPVDFATEPDLEERMAIVELLMADDAIDTVVLQITNATGERAIDYAEAIADVADRTEKPLFLVWTGGIHREEGIEICEEAGVPVFENPARCVETIAAIARFADSKDRLRAAQDLPARPGEVESSAKPADLPATLTEVEGKRLLGEYGVPTVEEELTTTPGEAERAAERFGYPVVAKLVGPEIPHRNRVDGVRPGLTTADAVADVAGELFAIGDGLDADVSGVLVQPQVDAGDELAAGIITDSDFGPVLMFGRGGTDIETIDDVTYRTVPVVEEQVASMFDELETVERAQFSDRQYGSIVDSLVSLSELYLENQWIVEADVNPLMVTEDGVVAVDALFV